MKTTTGAWTVLVGTRRTSWFAVLLAIALYSVALPVSNLASFGPIGGIIDELGRATNGWVAPQLAYPWITSCLVAVAIFGVGGLRAEDVGWRARAVIPAIVVAAFFWMSTQALSALVVSHSGQWSPSWWGREGSVLGSLLDQVFGAALLEETFFRGFLLPQAFLQASRVMRHGPSLVVALLASSSLFVLSHVPRLLAEGVAGGAIADELSWIFPWGLMLAVVFLVTRNLFLCVGLHSLWNARPTLIEVPWETTEGIWWIMTTVLLLGWWLSRIYRARQIKGPSGP